jgi:hypothetical protein
MFLNSEGISVLFLIIAMLLMVTIGYVFSYLIPTKQKSISFSISSNQAFFIAQSGVEYAVRYAADQGWRTPASLLGLNGAGVNQRSLGRGTFTISYDNTTDKLASIGVVPNASERRILVSNFTQFVGTENLSLDPNFQPCLTTAGGIDIVRFRIVSSSGITLDSFQSTWTGTPASVRINYILRDGSTIWGLGYYRSGDPRSYFSSTQTLSQNQSTLVEIQFSRTFNSGPYNIHVILYSTSGQSYDLILNSGSMLPPC